MGQLHELIAVEKDRKGTAQKIIAETGTTFIKKQHLFSGHVRTFEPKTDDPNYPKETAEETTVVTSVPEKLDYFEEHMINLFDVIIQKETTNCEAKGDIKIVEKDGSEVVIAQDVPVTALVQLENYLELLRNKVYDHVPTLDPKVRWKDDKARGEGYSHSDEKKVRRTVKNQEWAVIVEPTKEHPAVTKEIVKNVYIGDYVETHFSGMMSPADKSALLSRISEVIEAVKKARARANTKEVIDTHIGYKIFDFIRNGKKN